MQATRIEVNDNLQETVKHGSYDFPLAIYTDSFNLFEEGYIRWHWHKELQFSYSLYDKVVVFIEDEKITLAPGEGIMINSNVLHQIKPYDNSNCMMFSLNFDPALIGGAEASLIEKKYLIPIIESKNLKFISLKPNIQWQKKILDYLKVIFALSNEKNYGYELEMKNYLGILWLNLAREIKEEIRDSAATIYNDNERVKLAMQYIHKYYADNVLLDNIAMAANISKSECCRSFKRILKITPFEYLMEYRISKACELLLKNNESISNIAFDVGFNGISYFGKVFKKYRNCTPSEYRNKYNR
ncbi:bifunctional transcriptional activator/DNA repair enzyme AdaA [Clostridium puniceum]|uniref:Bifunctional transcriptional activator/DNA repair enzyme AdaA n=1 Tax=Clostridium puniceum TaxID=29367 RepID=A0A1S8TAS9_9CLOT|nr:helix-turn-helix domain-containing protein [Clostridium puniceum]OOM74782.1 bifunctional transcriptional activator/DNA repair enzyme AdaA [Clostridium puniceum]